MTEQRTSPSPLAGEGAERKQREACEGAKPLTKIGEGKKGKIAR
jgi:hypothetical protein